MKQFLLVIFAIVLSLASAKFLPAPYVWISVCWFLFFLYATISSNRPSIKPVWLNIGVILLAFGIFEGYLWISNPAEYRFEYNSTKGPRWSTKHEFLGKIPIKDNKISAKKYFGNELIYDAIYTIDSQGLRLSAPDTGRDDIRSLLFFGGSYMFGFGLNDTETMPYQVELKTKGNYRIYNFGVPNYGPHQMLSALEHGFASNIIEGKPSYAIYECIFDHVRRAAGLNRDARQGPKYTLGENGEIVYQGRFDEFDKEESKSLISKKVIKQLNKSLIFKKIIGRQKSANSDDIDLFIGIIAKSRDLLENDYPGIKFHLLFWDDYYHRESVYLMEEIINGLKGKGVNVHLISDILSVDSDKKWQDHRISYLDGHPNAKANEMIAEYLIKEIIIE